MPDRENVIYDIERCICHVPDACRDCSHYGHGEVIGCMEELLTDALALLKEQEDLGTELTNAVELIHKKNERIEQLNRFVNGFSRDAIPVVRCKDCINYGNNGCRLKRMAYQTASDWFCADGERK